MEEVPGGRSSTAEQVLDGAGAESEDVLKRASDLASSLDLNLALNLDLNSASHLALNLVLNLALKLALGQTLWQAQKGALGYALK